jgi:hypothetical protein
MVDYYNIHLNIFSIEREVKAKCIVLSVNQI